MHTVGSILTGNGGRVWGGVCGGGGGKHYKVNGAHDVPRYTGHRFGQSFVAIELYCVFNVSRYASYVGIA